MVNIKRHELGILIAVCFVVGFSVSPLVRPVYIDNFTDSPKATDLCGIIFGKTETGAGLDFNASIKINIGYYESYSSEEWKMNVYDLTSGDYVTINATSNGYHSVVCVVRVPGGGLLRSGDTIFLASISFNPI